MEDLVSTLTDLGWPAIYPLLAVASLLLALAAWTARRDAFAALVLGFTVFAPMWWVKYFAGVWRAYDPRISIQPAFYFIAAEAGLSILLFLVCAAGAGRALLTGYPIANRERTAALLIAAHTLHIHAMFTLIFLASSIPTWAYWAGRAWERLAQ